MQPAPGPSATDRRGRAARLGGVLAIAALVVAIDQTTKQWALRALGDGPRHVVWTLRLALAFNSGMAFSQATGATTVVTVVAAVVLGVLCVMAWRTSSTFSAVVLGLVMGGAVGNLADRLVRHHGGAVVDFIDLRWWPVFNLADAAISIGVVLGLGRSLLGSRDARA